MAGINDVRTYDGDMQGIVSTSTRIGANNAASKIIDILDACLVNGFNVNAVSSIVVSNGVALVTTPSDHGFRDYTVIRISGATPAELNGDWKITTAGGNSFSFPTAAANGSATGTMSAKTAPLGWSKPFSAAGLGVYRPGSGLMHYFRVSDPVASFVNVRGYKTMSDINNGTGAFPTVAQQTSGVDWFKYYMTSITGGLWRIYGDERFFYLIYDCSENAGVTGSAGPSLYAMGEVPTFSPADTENSVVIGANSGASSIYVRANYEGIIGCGRNSATSWFGNYFAGSPTAQNGMPVRFRAVGHALSESWGYNGASSAWIPPYPNPTDASMLTHTPVLLQEETGLSVRGIMPGVHQPLQSGVTSQKGNTHVINGRVVQFVGMNETSDNAAAGLIGFDTTGPWR